MEVSTPEKVVAPTGVAPTGVAPTGVAPLVLNLYIVREYFSDGTNGTLSTGNHFVCDTIELPWKNNQHRISCIKEGRYELLKRHTPEKGDHFILLHVENRDTILIHAANDALKELLGCIAPVTTLTGHGKGSASRPALAKLVELAYPVLNTDGGEVWLTITKKAV